MSCASVGTGQRFVAQMLGHIDCQAQTIGAYGYRALADPASATSLALTALLTIFIALFGLRLMMGARIAGRDVVGDMLRIGIVLTLATSWPAWRTLGYDLVLKGPAELAATIGGAADLPGGGGDMTARLQAVDDGIVLLTVYGTGRTTGGTNRSDTIGDSFRGVAVTDAQGLANGRVWFLAGVIGALAIVKLGAGLLLAIAPLMAGLLLFMGTRTLFFGWLRGLMLVALGSLALTVVQGVELAILDPWVRDALALRESQILTPSAPTELLVITLAFAAASFGILALLGKIAFFGGFDLSWLIPAAQPVSVPETRETGMRGAAGEPGAPSRAFVVAEAVAQTLRREQGGTHDRRTSGGTGPRGEAGAAAAAAAGRTGGTSAEPLGISYRVAGTAVRQYRRASAAGGRRDTA